MKRKVLVLAALAALLLGGWHVVRGWRETEEDRVRAVIDAIEAGIEERDVGDVMPHIAPGYSDRDGLSRENVKLLLLREFFVNKEGIGIQRGRTDVSLRGPKKAPRWPPI